MKISTTTESFAHMMSNGYQYHVPKYQRDYAWQIEQCEDLWEDIQEMDDEGHYMGYMLLTQTDKNQMQIIDGQQRIVTITLLILAYLNRLKTLIEHQSNPEDNQKRLDEIMKKYIGFTNTITLQISNRLTLNRNNQGYFKTLTNSLEAPNPRGLLASNKNIKKAFNYFVGQIKELDLDGIGVASQIERMSSGLIFTRVAVNSDANAYKLFETLNARGVFLSAPDLIKNHIFSTIDQESVTEEEMIEHDRMWADITQQLGNNSFTDYVRYLYNSEFAYSKKKNLFKNIVQKYDTPSSASAYLTHLLNNATIFACLHSPEDAWWGEEFPNHLPQIQLYLKFFGLFAIKQVNMILIVAYRLFSQEEFVKTMKYLYILVMRYKVICKESSNDLEKKINRLANLITHGDIRRASHLKNHEIFRSIYPNDDLVINQFKLLKFSNEQKTKKIGFLLAELEKNQGRKDTDFERLQLEHVCPQNPSREWHSAFGDGTSEAIYCLGNMVLLSEDRLARQSWHDKRQVYQTSGFRLAEHAATFAEWNHQTVLQMQEWMAGIAARTWSLTFDS